MKDQRPVRAERTADATPHQIWKNVLWRGKTVKVKPSLSFEEMIDCYNDITGTITDEATGMIRYELLDFTVKIYILAYYTQLEFPQTIEEQYDMIYNTDLYGSIAAAVNQEQTAAIKEAVYLYTGK